MSLSKQFNLYIFALLLLLPGFANAKTITFQDQKWDVPALYSEITSQPIIRNNFDLFSIAKSSLTGRVIENKTKIFDAQTILTLSEITTAINQPAVDARLVIENNFAKEFIAPQNGQAVDLYRLSQTLGQNQEEIALPVIFSEPNITLGSTNNLGIKELVAIGESNFTGSPNNRIHNINVGATKFNGIIISQGEEFSFNKYLGPVDGEHGFLPELVIKRTGVVPEFGGGLCQVSSTSFRAAMNAGLPITERRNHSFAVQYYAPQGTDATIYPGSTDLRFVNDSPGPILIHTKIVDKKLFFEYYGTKDNRVITFEGPVQYDKKANGAMKATWTRHVSLNGQTTDQTFNSVYLPPALFHPEPVPPPTPPPTETPTETPTEQTNEET